MKLFLHVGLPKTATTFLQAIFSRHPHVGYVGRPYTQENGCFNKLQYSLDGTYDTEEFAKEITSWKSTFDSTSTIIISDELLSGFPLYNFINRTMIAERLSQVIPDAEVILYLRNQRDLLFSLYNHYVKIGWISHPLDGRFVTAPGEGLSRSAWMEGDRQWRRSRRFIDNRSYCNVEHFRYSSLIELYHQRFAKTHVLLYEDLKADLAAHLEHLGSILSVENLAAFAESGESTRNASLPDNQLIRKLAENRLESLPSSLLQRLLNRWLVRRQVHLPEQSRQYLDQVLQQSGLAEDNKLVNARWQLGMERHDGYAFT